jgi:hypothetical protein
MMMAAFVPDALTTRFGRPRPGYDDACTNPNRHEQLLIRVSGLCEGRCLTATRETNEYLSSRGGAGSGNVPLALSMLDGTEGFPKIANIEGKEGDACR